MVSGDCSKDTLRENNFCDWRLRESWPFRLIEKKGEIFFTDFGLRFFYTNPSQILASLADFSVKKSLRDAWRFTYLHIDGILFTHLWNIYTSVKYLHRCQSYTTQRYVVITYRCVV
jgi:hypothetical protein